MPERTTPRQRMIALARQHLSGPGVTVTESKKLYDQYSGQAREVDVVAEGELGGEDLILSVEVVDRKRRMSLTWVDEMWGKHASLPTNQLVLISWSGFSRPAWAKINATPRMKAVHPQAVLGEDGSPRVAETLYVDQTRVSADVIKVKVRGPDGADTVQQIANNVGIYNDDHEYLGPAGEFANELVRSEPVGRRLGIDAHGREDRADLKAFSLGLERMGEHVRLFLRNSGVDPPEFHQIIAIHISGQFTWEQTELQFAVVDIDGRAHGVAQAPMFGRDAVWVATPTADDPDQVQISWRAMDGTATPDES
jgi:hypothetical protein